MNFVPCLTWVCKGKAANVPHKLQLSPEELKQLANETNKKHGEHLTSEDDSSGSSNEECEVDEKINNQIIDEEDDDIEAKYNLDAYDNDDEDRPLFKLSNIAVHVDNKDDQYITSHDSECEDELEEQEDFVIKNSDNLLIVGHIEDQSSVMEIYVYNQEEDTFYVHHDIVLPSYPLALEWLDFHSSESLPGNYVAVGDMSPVIKVWDLDIVDGLEPEFVLGENENEGSQNNHSDAVLSLSWNRHKRNILASGCADSSIILWDLDKEESLNKLDYHPNKVQSLQWHNCESHFLLSGCTDGFIKLYDCRAPGNEFKSWKITSEIEKVTWNLFNSFKFFCSAEDGYIYSLDIRHDKIENSLKAHNEAVTGLDMSPLCPNILLTASMDKTMKMWNIENEIQLIKSWKLKVGSVYTAKVAPDLEFTVALGGNNASNNLKVMNVADYTKGFGEQDRNSHRFYDAEQQEENGHNMKYNSRNQLSPVQKKRKIQKDF